MSKANTIRKKALEYARRQNWDAAIREYQRLAEIDQSNPNLHNELGDIYLKVSNRVEAYAAFATAIDAYARVSLFNNAVAVCKKVLRLIPVRYQVLAKLGCIRKKQGLEREAESYCLQYLEQLAQDPGAEATEVAETAESITEVMTGSAVVLDRLAESLFNRSLDQEAARVLARLYTLYGEEGIEDAQEAARQRLESMGMAFLIDSEPDPESSPEKDGPVITEENIWTDSLSEGERITVQDDASGPDTAVEPMAMPESPDTDSVYDYRSVSLGSAQSDGDVVVLGGADAPNETPDAANPSGEDIVQVSAIIGDSAGDASEGVEQEDFRSHYDLGMAYLEMNLFADAVREYQMAARSSEFQVKSLEMIGLCFLKQNQAHLAIKQLTRGLAQIDPDDSEALGIKYNLGLAYEMAGDEEKARALFEDVYVVDVSFRDVASKVAAYSRS